MGIGSLYTSVMGVRKGVIINIECIGERKKED